MVILKDKMKISTEKNLKEYETLLQALKCSNAPNKEQRNKDCEYAIKKEQILSNLKHYKKSVMYFTNFFVPNVLEPLNY